jgi:drug/metabolite transporter (DMT)-like permease
VTGRNTYVVFESRPIGELAALSGAILFTIFDVLSILLFAKKENFSVITATGSYAFFVGPSLLALMLIQVGLVGLYVRHSEATSGASGVLGLVGFLVTFLGMALAVGS